MKKNLLKILWSAWMASLLGLSVVLSIADDVSRSMMFLAIYVVCVIHEQFKDFGRSADAIWYQMYLRNKHEGIEK